LQNAISLRVIVTDNAGRTELNQHGIVEVGQQTSWTYNDCVPGPHTVTYLVGSTRSQQRFTSVYGGD
jgi:hypothetical protein